MIPIVDLFAGPGGLGEGFSALETVNHERAFKIVLSIEKDLYAFKTLNLRSFFRQFDHGKVPSDYYDFIRGKILLSELLNKWPKQAELANKETWLAELGGREYCDSEVDKRISDALQGEKNWVLIGGPPCQAYSIIGRSRRQEIILDEKKDSRVGLYKQYLRILAVHNPAVFIMENVKGLLSAKTKESHVFSQIYKDLTDPLKAHISDNSLNGHSLECPGYRIYSLIKKPNGFDLENNPIFNQQDFIIHSEEYGIPQTRHRLIILGIRKDIVIIPETIEKSSKVPISRVISGLPRIRSTLSKDRDDLKTWINSINQIQKYYNNEDIDAALKGEILKQLKKMNSTSNNVGSNYIPFKEVNIDYKKEWFIDKKIDGVCNHLSRGHMASDLQRYFYITCFAKLYGRSPILHDLPKNLLPNHVNVNNGTEDYKFADRFRVQLWNEPSKTITSHISKDGHYYIHPDPVQCRSLTVREAARIQTFPDNYYFVGPRTEQFIQVGNAVPPLLANQISKVVFNIFNPMLYERSN